MKPDDQLIAEVRELDAKATKGKWRAARNHTHYKVVWINKIENYSTLELEPDDADFIAAARTLLPDLANRLEAANERVKELKKEINQMKPKTRRKLELRPTYGTHLPIEPKNGWAWMAGGDGSLYWATETHYAPWEPVFPSDPPNWATHILYFGK